MIRRIAFVFAIAMGSAIGLSTASAVSPLLKEFENAFIELSEKVGPAVVEISAETDAPDRSVNEFFRFFTQPDEEEDGGEEGEGGETPEENSEEEDPSEDGEDGEENGTPSIPEEIQRRLRRQQQQQQQQMQEEPPPTATGSGFIFDKQGHIVTNNHVVENAKKLTVLLHDGTEHEATLVGSDPDSDLAVIKIDPKGADLPVAAIGDSNNLRVGQFAIAMGSPRGLTGSVAFGHISGLGRERLNLPDAKLRFQNFIQTDAGINLGNSGGPLCDIDGNVIGVNIAIVWGANSIGFAIPISRAKQIVPQLIAQGRVVRGWLGVSIMEIEAAATVAGQETADYIQAYNLPDEMGVYVKEVTWGGPAAEAKLQEEDVIWKIDSVVVKDTIDLINRISDVQPGQEVKLDVYRAGALIVIPVKVNEFPGRDAAVYGFDVLGIHVVELNDDYRSIIGLDKKTTGIVIPTVVPKSPAADEGLERGDVVLKVAHEEVKDRDHFKQLMIENAKPGEALLLHVKKAQGEIERKFIKVPITFNSGTD